jgi:ABC-type transporter Mla maintaining outer membrane lipid asymmetry ATPase subunit MlaF
MDSAFRIADRMIMLQSGKIMQIGTRAEFEALRAADPTRLATDAERLLHQFLRGSATGPLTDAEGMSEYEKILVGSKSVVPR